MSSVKGMVEYWNSVILEYEYGGLGLVRMFVFLPFLSVSTFPTINPCPLNTTLCVYIIYIGQQIATCS